MSYSQPQDDVVARGTAYCDDHFTQSLASRFRRGTDGARLYTEKGRETYEDFAGPSDIAARRDARRSEASGSVRTTRLVVAFSGGCSSRTLLDLVKKTYFSHLLPSSASSELTSEPNGKGKGKKHGLPRRPVFAELEVVSVDESSVPGEPHFTAEVRRIVQEATPFARFTALKLEDVFASAHSSALPLSVSTVAPSLPVVPPFASSSASADDSDSRRTHLVSLLSNPSLSLSSLASLRTALRSSLILSHVRHSSSPAVLLLGDSGTRSAITTLAGMSLGRGFSIGEESGAEYLAASPDNTSGTDGQSSGAVEVLVVRPLVHATLGEVEHYCRLMGLQTLPAQQRGVVDESAKKKTIQGLVEDFILSLEASFPSTVSTVTRTSHKLGLRSSHASFLASQTRSRSSVPLETACLCPVCGLPAPERGQAEFWRETIAISDLQAVLRAEGEGADATLRTTGEEGIQARRKPYEPSKAHLMDPAGAAGETVANGDAPASAAPPPPEADDAGPSLAPYLCYGCLIALSSSSSAAAKKPSSASSTLVLPPYVQDALRSRIERDQGIVRRKESRREEDLRKEVEEFLLDDEEDGAGAAERA
ncbi:Cytoplasmic tRNA 2-thiolation protein 2 [Rhodotorula toruloides]